LLGAAALIDRRFSIFFFLCGVGEATFPFSRQLTATSGAKEIEKNGGPLVLYLRLFRSDQSMYNRSWLRATFSVLPSFRFGLGETVEQSLA